MATRTPKLSLAGLLVALPVSAAIRTTAATVQVSLINAAAAPRQIVARAQEIAAEVFRAAGVEIVWAGFYSSDLERPSGVEHRPSAQTLTVVINMNPTRSWSRNALGCALPLAAGGNHAGVFYLRIARLARDPVHGFGASEAEILGYAVAHELGHLLLHTNLHSPDGLMRAGWTQGDLYAMRHGKLLFSHAEANTLRRRGGRPENPSQAEHR